MQRFVMFVLALVGGCNLVQLVSPGSVASSTGPEGSHHVQIDGRIYRVGPYWGPECEAIGADKREVYRGETEAEPTGGKQPNLAHDPTEQILRLVCVETILSSTDEPERNTWVMQHFRFDELAFDHLTAAMMLVQCLKADSCLGEGARPHHQELHNDIAERMRAEQEAQPRRVSSYYEVGMMRWYADRVDPRAVAAKLATIALPPGAVQAFMTQLDKARTRVIAVSDELVPEAKKLFLELPAQVLAQRAAERAKHGTAVADLLALADRVKTERAAAAGVSDDTIDKLRKLRVSYHAGCKADCTRDAVFAAITRQLFWSYVSRGDAAAAMAETKLLEHLDPTAAMEIATKQSAAIDKARGRVARVESARNQGIDADTARSTANGSLLDYGDGRYVYRWASDFAIDWNALVPDGHEVGHVGGKVAALERKGPNVVIRFQDEVSSYSEGTDCYETNRIDGIGSDGRLIYREACRGETTHVERHKVDPVTVPANEAANLHGGDEIVGFARGNGDARIGRIWLVKRGQRVTRLREMTL